MHTVEKAQENKTIDPNESVWTTRGIERNSRKNRTADDRLIGCPGTGGTTAIGLRGSWLDTYMRGSAGKRSTNAAWCASNQRGVASCRAGRFIHQDPGYNATRKIPFFSLLSLAPPFETCEENDGGRERCSPLISRRFENVCHVPRPCNAWIVQGVVVCEVECCFDTEGVRRYSSGGGDGRKRCLNYLVRSWRKFALVGTCY